MWTPGNRSVQPKCTASKVEGMGGIVSLQWLANFILRESVPSEWHSAVPLQPNDPCNPIDNLLNLPPMS